MTSIKRRPTAAKNSRKSPSAPRARAATQAAPAMIPERGLKIGEAAGVIGVETYVLRFWETQFPFLKPKHSRTRHRFYHERDLEVLRLIKTLLHQQGFTIAGANKFIRERGLDSLLRGDSAPASAAAPAHPATAASAQPRSAGGDGPTRRVLNEVRRDLENLHKLLDR
jgi:DNA-binding transcriptional MerR regulator